MGQEITSPHFSHRDFQRYQAALAQEMALLHSWFAEGRFSSRHSIGGLELEAWLIDGDGAPLPINEAFLKRLAMPTVVPELSRFNIELNVMPQALAGGGLDRLERELRATWQRCAATAAELDAAVLAVGILPTVANHHLVAANMSDMRRYHALNEQVLRLRQGQALNLNIVGREHLHSQHHDVMLEAAATSLQVHLQVTADSAARHYNAAIIASAPLVAASANSPYLFGKDLWDETRIPLFEQAVDLGAPARRVTFGSDYAKGSLECCFHENSEHYPILLPLTFNEPPEHMAHLRLHNGTIWRWNRPLLGFDDDGTPHLRIEHRVMPAGPTFSDMLANIAFFYGLCITLATRSTAPESRLPFATARDNFYEAARRGLDSVVHWEDGKRWPMAQLLQRELLPLARTGLEGLGVDGALIAHYLDLIEARIASGQNGSVWQRKFVARHGRDMQALTHAYQERQRSNEPVHRWDV
jgi:gamma-glutamyl:cysteine ligase YbdK (ATP-grasp superfamily)